MTARNLSWAPLGVLLLAPGPAMAQKRSKPAFDMQSVPVKAAPRPAPRPTDSPGAGPRLTLEEFESAKRARVQEIIDKQITYLRGLIRLASPDDPKLPDYWFRLGELFAEKYRYFEHEARRLDEAIFRAKQQGDAEGQERQRQKQEGEQEKAGHSLRSAVSHFVTAARYPRYPRLDEVLFRLGYLLQAARHEERAREVFHRLLKEYPQSRFVPDAYLAFADHFFAGGEMAAALDFYRKVTQFPHSGVYGFALYKQAWAEANLGDYRAALATFVDVLSKCQAGEIAAIQRAALEREARRDLVRVYARTPGADPGRAFEFFQRVAGAAALPMLHSLAELYWEEGMAAVSSRVYRKAMALAPESAQLCTWQGKVLRNTLSAGTEPEQVQELQRLGTTWRHLQRAGTASAELLAACAASYRDSARELAFVLHKQAQRLQQPATFALAAEAYRALLGGSEGAPPSDVAFYYAECLWQLASFTAGDARRWREAAEQYTRVVHLDPRGPYVKEAAYAAVLAWQNALYDSDADLRERPRPGLS